MEQTPVTVEMIEELKRLEKAATVAPWRASETVFAETLVFADAIDHSVKMIIRGGVHVDAFVDAANMRLTAAARNALPALLALAEQVHAGRWRQVKDEMPSRVAVLVKAVDSLVVEMATFNKSHGRNSRDYWYGGNDFEQPVEPDDWWQPISPPPAGQLDTGSQ